MDLVEEAHSHNLVEAVAVATNTAPGDETRRIQAIKYLYMIAREPASRDELVRAGALAPLLAAAGDKDLWGREGQLLAIGALGLIAYVTDPVQRARKMRVVNEGGIDILISVATDTNMQGTIFQQQALETIWSICCSKQVNLQCIQNHILLT
jgi:hypothetical protein